MVAGAAAVKFELRPVVLAVSGRWQVVATRTQYWYGSIATVVQHPFTHSLVLAKWPTATLHAHLHVHMQSIHLAGGPEA